MSLTSIIALLQAALMLLGLASAPGVPQAQKDAATQVANQAITQATQELSKSQHTRPVASGHESSTAKAFEITSPSAGGKAIAGQSIAIEWTTPREVLESIPSDFKVGLFLNVVRADVPDVNVYGINDGTNDPRSGSVSWKIPADALAGSYKIVGYMQATPKDPARMCDKAYSTHTDCSPSPSDTAIMQRVARYKAESGLFAIGVPLAATVSVLGMSQYTDKDFGFSFWYPSGWKVSDLSGAGSGMFAGTTDRAGNLSMGRIIIRSPDGEEIDIDKVHSDTRTYDVNPGACGYCGPVRYFFDASLHQWMKQYPSGMNGAPDATTAQIEASKAPVPADVSRNNMGGLHLFSTEQKENAVILPLSARNFLVVRGASYTGRCATGCASDRKGDAAYLANTILATDPAVATPVSQAEQIKVIQAEKDAYAGQ